MNIDELEQLAKPAIYAIGVIGGNENPTMDDLQHVANYARAANPSAILAMIAELREAEKVRAQRNKLRNALIGVIGAESKVALTLMKEYVQESGADNETKRVTCAAIDALLETMPYENEVKND